MSRSSLSLHGASDVIQAKIVFSFLAIATLALVHRSTTSCLLNVMRTRMADWASGVLAILGMSQKVLATVLQVCVCVFQALH